MTAQSGTYFWHGHVGTSYFDGLKGPIIIHNPVEPYPYDIDYVVQLSDWYHDVASDLLAFWLDPVRNPTGGEPSYNSGLINGKGAYDCQYTTLPCIEKDPEVFTVSKGGLAHLRFINAASLAVFIISIENHAMTVVEVDGVPVEPYTTDAFVINIGQRYT